MTKQDREIGRPLENYKIGGHEGCQWAGFPQTVEPARQNFKITIQGSLKLSGPSCFLSTSEVYLYFVDCRRHRLSHLNVATFLSQRRSRRSLLTHRNHPGTSNQVVR